VVDRYGPPEVVRVAEVPVPEPGPEQVLVRVVAVAVTSGDARIRAGRFPKGFAIPVRLAFGLRGPRRPVLGSTFSGVVETVGSKVEGIAPGDPVCGMTGMRMGAHAEHVAVDARRIVPKPDAVDHDQAAGVLFGGTTALHFLRKAGVTPGSTVLVNGASGAVGTNIVQLARNLGAAVTGVTSSANAALVASLGATEIIDRTVVVLGAVDLGTSAARYDVVVDTVGNLGIRGGRRLLAEGGRLLLVVASLGETIRARGDVVAGSGAERTEDMTALLQDVAEGRLTVVLEPPVDLDDIVAAHRLVDSGRKVGNVVVHP
jgi:NADPH:quinone reductase-like Zn-dependent oxidoreductase